MLRFHVITLFPAMIAPFVEHSIVGRARTAGLIDVTLHDLFDELAPKERPDDRPYGGGPGMVLRIEPIARVLERILAAAGPTERRAIVVPAAAAPAFTQADALELAVLDRVIFVCGHYEGIDERLIELYGARERSLGSFVLTGGEIPAIAFLDAAVRHVPGVLKPGSVAAESYMADAFDHPAYTRPPIFRGAAVPAVLLSGDHGRIAAWREEQARGRGERLGPQSPPERL